MLAFRGFEGGLCDLLIGSLNVAHMAGSELTEVPVFDVSLARFGAGKATGRIIRSISYRPEALERWIVSLAFGALPFVSSLADAGEARRFSQIRRVSILVLWSQVDYGATCVCHLISASR